MYVTPSANTSDWVWEGGSGPSAPPLKSETLIKSIKYSEKPKFNKKMVDNKITNKKNIDVLKCS